VRLRVTNKPSRATQFRRGTKPPRAGDALARAYVICRPSVYVRSAPAIAGAASCHLHSRTWLDTRPIGQTDGPAITSVEDSPPRRSRRRGD